MNVFDIDREERRQRGRRRGTGNWRVYVFKPSDPPPGQLGFFERVPTVTPHVPIADIPTQPTPHYGTLHFFGWPTRLTALSNEHEVLLHELRELIYATPYLAFLGNAVHRDERSAWETIRSHWGHGIESLRILRDELREADALRRLVTERDRLLHKGEPPTRSVSPAFAPPTRPHFVERSTTRGNSKAKYAHKAAAPSRSKS